MRLRTIALVLAGVLAVAAVTTASAAGGGGGGPFGIFKDDADERRAEYAKDLAGELGIEQQRVEDAMKSVDTKRRDAHEAEQAKALAAKLDVSEADAEKALEAGHAAIEKQMRGVEKRMREGLRDKPPFERRLRRVADPFTKAVAKALDKDTDDVIAAFQEIRRDKLEAELSEAVKDGRLSEEQADRIRERIKSGRLGPGKHGHGPGGGPGGEAFFGPPPG